MKKTLLIIGLIVAGAFSANAQSISKNAIGLRLGDNDGFGGEISYQRALGDNNRLEIDLGLRDNNNYDGFKATGLYQWVWNIDGGFNWYAGVGGGLGNYSGKDNNNNFSETFVFAAGDVGIEYNFPSAPILLSLDLRPEFGFGKTFNDYDNDIALSIRYQF
ncbi:hypothetical protein H9W90_08645 [Polaribacter pectinis]|uniref:Outer membrane protein beta-barrel domain-containing protein n=1 Tax=Polaribacter pectinis TaxID=2738844 RepID=A0A7G9L6N1_9FLAO|nr:hypothetical protein [Polaribacter pectinis]QNM84280.1 hypothetical protein H9W90_08645 [Polaribacter pectinis]